MSGLFVKDIDYIVSCDDKDTVYENVNLRAVDGVITEIGKDVKMVDGDEVIDASGMIMYPGLINTHHHLYQIFTRNIEETQNMELFPWLKYLYELWKNIDEDVIGYTSRVGMVELAKNGCTTVFDHHYVFPANTGDLIGAQFRASDEVGVRFHASRGSMDLSKKDGGLPPDSVVQSIDEILKDSINVIEKYHQTGDNVTHQVALAPCSPFSVTEDLLAESAKLARQYKVRLHTHLCETLDEENFMLETRGMRPVAFMEKVGWIGDDVWYAHGIHFNDEEIKLLGETGTGVAHCPISNMKLSSGIARVKDLLDHNVPVGLAVDGSASNDGSNLLEELRVSFLLHRLNCSYDAPSGYDILKMATRGSARVLGRNDIGQLANGKGADFFMIRKDKLELVGALTDPKAVLATVGYKQPVDYTVCNGQIIVKDGKSTTIDEDKLVADSNKCFEEFIKKN